MLLPSPRPYTFHFSRSKAVVVTNQFSTATLSVLNSNHHLPQQPHPHNSLPSGKTPRPSKPRSDPCTTGHDEQPPVLNRMATITFFSWQSDSQRSFHEVDCSRALESCRASARGGRSSHRCNRARQSTTGCMCTHTHPHCSKAWLAVPGRLHPIPTQPYIPVPRGDQATFIYLTEGAAPTRTSTQHKRPGKSLRPSCVVLAYMYIY